ncbi:WD40-repeat-containing domain protein [Zopfochytrium polystomum]|nr:WD40-repeat-containing domain protein [Zopfochytrium polystomum]
MNVVEKSSASPILFVNFNQDASCLSVGTRSGYKIFNCDPFGKFYSRTDGGIGIVEMLFCTSLVAVVGAGEQPAFSPRRLQITNTKRQSTICELTFVTAILAVKLNRKRLIVVLEEHIYIYDIGNMKLLHTIDTSPNPNASGDLLIFDAISLQAVNIIQAHKSPLSCINFNHDGTLIATASDKGTVIRVFSVPTGNKLFQFRRGSYNARIYSLSFDLNSTLLSVSSDTDTVHVFRLVAGESNASGERKGSASGSSSSTRSSSTEKRLSAGSTSSGSSSSILSAGLGTAERTFASMYNSLRSPIASATNYILPDVITEIWEPQRDFAYAKIPTAAKGLQNICAISSATSLTSPAGSPTINPLLAGSGNTNGGLPSSNSTASPTPQPHYVMVVTAAGLFYQYAIDMENGGECVLLRESSLLDEV